MPDAFTSLGGLAAAIVSVSLACTTLAQGRPVMAPPEEARSNAAPGSGPSETTFTLQTVPVWIALPPTQTDRWTIELQDQFLSDVEVSGPPALIKRLQSGEISIKALVELDTQDLESGIQEKAVRFSLLPTEIKFPEPHPVVRFRIEPRSPSSVAHLLSRAQQSINASDWQTALELLLEARGQNDANASVEYGLALCAVELGRKQLAEQALARLLELRPEAAADEQAQRLLARAGDLSSLSPDERLVLKQVEILLRRAGQSEQSLDERMRLAREARERLAPLLADIEQSDVDVWRMAGAIAVILEDAEWAAYAFEAIERIRPDYASDPAWLELMASLRLLPIAEGVEIIRENRPHWLEESRQYRKAADAGDVDAMFSLGRLHRRGEGVPRDDAEAVEWWRRAADAGHAYATLFLGVMYDNGDGVPEDDAKAVEWYRKAADAGDVIAMYELGVKYDNGEGVSKDDAKAVEWYRKAADAGHEYAMYNLGVMYANGRGVPKDDAKAVEWYRKAARKGHSTAQSNLRERGLDW